MAIPAGQANSADSENALMSAFDLEGDGPQPTEGNHTDEDLVKAWLVIDPKYKGLDPQIALARTIQGRVDGVKSEAVNIAHKNEELLEQVRFFDEMKSSPELQMAWLAEINPELHSSFNTEESVKRQLAKEFGADFQPKDEEKSNPFSQTAKYFRRADALLSGVSAQSTKKVKDILDARKVETEKKAKKIAGDLKKIQEEEGWGKAELEGYLNWYKGLDLFAGKKMYKFALAKAGLTPSAPGNLGSSKSGGGFVSFDKLNSTLNSMFGPQKSGFKKEKT